MKKLIPTLLLSIFLNGCDPVADLEANIENLTSEDLIIEFISFDENLSKTLNIPVNEERLFQEGFDIGSDFLEPSLVEYDSVVIKSNSERILKVYKPNDIGKNIYNIDEYWFSSEPSKRFYKYRYEINNEDLD